MNAQEIVEELTQVCIQMRFHLNDLTERREKETLILKHIKRFENSGAKIRDFSKGTDSPDLQKRVPCALLSVPLCELEKNGLRLNRQMD